MAMEVRCSVLEINVLCVVMLIVESVDKELMPASVAVRAGTWLRTTHRNEVRMEVMSA